MAHFDALRIPANGWSYPYATGMTVLARGELRTCIRAHDFPRAFAQDISLLPLVNWPLLPEGRRESVFWYDTTSSNTLLTTWWNAALGRDATNPVNFQAELFPDGGFTYRYEDRTVRHARVWPFDWDDDGLENTVDPDPLTPGSDAHGTNAEWYNAVCSNLFSAVEGGGTGTTGILPVDDVSVLPWRAGVNSNAYYFVDVVTERGPAPIYFTGDRESRLGDPVVVARAFETNRVPLLIGVDYSITSDTPFTVSYPMEYMYPEVETNEPCRAHIRWPLNFVFTESIGASNRVYTVTVEPYDPGGVFEWGGPSGGVPMRGGSSGGGCDCVSYGVNSVWFSCSSTCTCESGCSAHGSYLLEAASFSVDGGECRCGFDDPPPDSTPSSHEPDDLPSLTITFSKPAVIFEDAYENEPGVTVPRRSTRVRLTIDAYAGAQGGGLWISGVNMNKLVAVDGDISLPYSQQLAACESYHATGVFEGFLASDSVQDVIVSGVFTETGTRSQVSTSKKVTVVRVELTPEFAAPENDRIHRHTFGVRESVLCRTWPTLPVSAWQTSSTGSFRESGGIVYFTCPILAALSPLSITYAGVGYCPPGAVLEPTGIVARSPKADDYGFPKGTAGGAGMTLELYVKPLNVSFVGIAVEEVPTTTGIHTGYFANSSWQLAWYHTTDRGAGDWKNVQPGNFFMEDNPRMAEECEPPWQTGSIVWDIPIGWGERNQSSGEAPVKTCGTIYDQTFEITSNGALSVTKFGYTVTRGTNDFIFLMGEE